MSIKKRIVKVIAVIMLAAMLFQTVACGTILYPDRRGLKSGRIDPAIVILDGIGCLFFIVPGLVAFIVDFATGAIYLPPGQKSILDSSVQDADTLPVAGVKADDLDLNTLELLITAKTGQVVDLNSPDLKIYEVNDSSHLNYIKIR